jgi:hypothetical protein
VSLKADTESPVLTGTPKVPDKTSAAGTDGTLIATEAQVKTVADSDALKAPIESPVLTGTPTAPTPEASANNTQIATTAFVKAFATSSFWPVGSFYTQYPMTGQATIAGMFPSNTAPATLFGGTWTEMYAGEKVFFMGGLSSVESNRSNGIQEDAIRNITGEAGLHPGWGLMQLGYATGAFKIGSASGKSVTGCDVSGHYFGIDISGVVPTDSTNHPRNRPVKIWRRTA